MSRGLAKNAMLSGVSWLVPAACAVIAIPITVRGLGTDGYGVMALVAAVTGYLALMDLGLANGVIRYLSMFVAADNGTAIRGCMRTVLKWFAAAGVIGFSVMWMLSPWLVGHVLKVPADLAPQAIVAFRIGGATFGLGMLVSVLSLLPQAFLRYDLVATVGGLLAGASVAGPAVIVSLGYGLIPVMWFGAVLNGVACVAWGAFGLHLIRSVPALGPDFSEFRGEFLRFSAVSAANRLASVISLQTSRMVVGIAGGTAMAAYYQVPLLVSSNVNGLINKMGTVLLPTASYVVARGDRDALVSLYERSSRLLFLLNSSVSGALIVFSGPLLAEWVGVRFAQAGAAALAILTLTQLINAASMPASNLNLALGLPRVNLFFSLASSAVSLATVYWLTVRYGVTGTAIAGLMGSLLVPIFLHYAHTRILHVRTLKVAIECYLRPAAGVSTVCALAWFVARPLATNLLLAATLTGLVTVIGFAAAAAAGGLTSEDWAELRSVLSSLGGTGRPPAGEV